MDVLLDSSILIQDLTLRGKRLQTVYQYLKQSGRKLVMPEVVIQEVEAHYARALHDALRKAQDAARDLRRLGTQSVRVEVADDIAAETQRFHDLLLRPEAGVEVEVIGNEPSDLRESVRRLADRVAPAHRGSEYRDVLIWLALLSYARRRGDEVAFISDNKSDFGDPSGDGLHRELLRDIDGLRVRYFREIEGLLHTQAAAFMWADEAWARSRLPEHPDVRRAILGDSAARTRELRALVDSRRRHSPDVGKVRVLTVSDTVLQDYVLAEDTCRALVVSFSVRGKLSVAALTPYAWYDDDGRRTDDESVQRIELDFHARFTGTIEERGLKAAVLDSIEYA